MSHKPRSRSHEPKGRRVVASCYFGYQRSVMCLDWLPDPLLKHIFSYLDWKDLLRLSGVNQRWHEITGDPDLWFRFATQHSSFHPAPITRALSQGPETYNWKIPFIQRKKAELIQHKFQPTTTTSFIPSRLEPKQKKWYSSIRNKVKKSHNTASSQFDIANNYGSPEFVIVSIFDNQFHKLLKLITNSQDSSGCIRRPKNWEILLNL
jgi:hypothetical protein